MKIKRVLRIAVWSLCFFFISPLLLFQIPPVQNILHHLLLKQIQQKTDLLIEIEKMNGLLPFWCHCEGVKVSSASTSDNSSCCHFEAGYLDLVVNPFSLFYKTLTIQHLGFTKTRCHSFPTFTNHTISTPKKESSPLPFNIHVHHFEFNGLELGETLFSSLKEEPFIFSLSGFFSYDQTKNLFAKVMVSLPSQQDVLQALFESDPPNSELTLSTHLHIPAKCPELQKFINQNRVNFDLPPMDLRISGKAPYAFWSSLFNPEKQLQGLTQFAGEIHGTIQAPPPPCQEWFLWQFGKTWEIHSQLNINSEGDFILPSLNLKTSNMQLGGQLGWTAKGSFIESFMLGSIRNLNLFVPDNIKQDLVLEGELIFEGPLKGTFAQPLIDFSYKTDQLTVIYLTQEMSPFLKEKLSPSQISGKVALEIGDGTVDGSVLATTFLFDSKAEFESHIQWKKNSSLSLLNSSLHIMKSRFFGDLNYIFNTEINPLATISFEIPEANFWEPFVQDIVHTNISLTGSLEGLYHSNENEEYFSLVPRGLNIENLLIDDGNISLYKKRTSEEWLLNTKLFNGSLNDISFESLTLATKLVKGKANPYLLEAESRQKFPFHISSSGIYKYEEHSFSIHINNLLGQWFNYPFILRKPADFVFQENRTDVQSFSLDIGAHQEAELQGSFQRIDNEFSLQLSMSHLPLEMINPFSQRLPMSGEISSSVYITQKEGEISGQFDLKMNQIDLLDIAYDTIPYLNFYLTGMFHQHSVEFEGQLSGFSEQPFKIHSEVPFSVSFDPFEITLKKDLPFYLELIGQAPLTPLTSFLIDETIIVQAVADVKTLFSGTLNNPELSGVFSVRNATIESIKTGALAKNVELEIIGSGSQFTLNKFKGVDPYGGILEASGFIQIDFNQGLSYDIDIDSQNFRLVELDPVTADVNVELNFLGSTEGASLTGTITVTDSSVIIPKEPPVSIPFVEVTYCNILCEHIKEFIAKPSPLNLFLDLDVQIPRNLSIEGRGLESEWKGVIHISGKAPELVYSGELEVVAGEFIFSNRTFELTCGQIEVNGLKTRDIYININAELQLNELLITVNLKGPLSEPQVTLTSNPSLCTTEILSWILFDSELSEISAFQALQITQALIALSGRYAGPDFLGKIKDALGLDVLDISSADIDTADVTFQVGKYISKGIFVGMNKSVSGDRDAISVQAKVTRRLSLQADLGGDAGGKLIFKWYRSY